MKNKCCICNVEFEGWGHNPAPLSSWGTCCKDCNNDVIRYRVYQLMRSSE